MLEGLNNNMHGYGTYIWPGNIFINYYLKFKFKDGRKYEGNF